MLYVAVSAAVSKTCCNPAGIAKRKSARISAMLGRLVRNPYGLPNFKPGWAQFRALGAAALDICLVADGTLDGWVDMNSHGVWDYLASILICQEAGVVAVDHLDRELLVTTYDDKRTPIVAASSQLLAQLRQVRLQHAG